MESRHTPGELSVRYGNKTVARYLVPQGEEIREAHRLVKLDRNEQNAAFLNTIAAAPDLLDRLKVVTDTLASLQGEDWETIKSAREIITKATGQAGEE